MIIIPSSYLRCQFLRFLKLNLENIGQSNH